VTLFRALAAPGALVALALLLDVAGAAAASFTLGERQVQEAAEVGERSVTRDGLGDEWRVRNPAGDVLTVMTPFHRLAMAARHAAFRNDPLKPRERNRVLKEQQDRLVFWVELKGAREDFARFYTPRLIVGARHIEPAFAQNERTPGRGEDGKFLAHCVYAFPTKALTGTSKVVLVVHDGDGHDVTTFSIDLASMR
jgi:hypothetical protein